MLWLEIPYLAASLRLAAHVIADSPCKEDYCTPRMRPAPLPWNTPGQAWDIGKCNAGYWQHEKHWQSSICHSSTCFALLCNLPLAASSIAHGKSTPRASQPNRLKEARGVLKACTKSLMQNHGNGIICSEQGRGLNPLTPRARGMPMPHLTIMPRIRCGLACRVTCCHPAVRVEVHCPLVPIAPGSVLHEDNPKQSKYCTYRRDFMSLAGADDLQWTSKIQGFQHCCCRGIPNKSNESVKRVPAVMSPPPPKRPGSSVL